MRIYRSSFPLLLCQSFHFDLFYAFHNIIYITSHFTLSSWTSPMPPVSQHLQLDSLFPRHKLSSVASDDPIPPSKQPSPSFGVRIMVR